MGKYNGRTDLAVEINEEVNKKDGRLYGVVVDEKLDKESGICVTELKIINRTGEIALKKPKGTYITIEAKELADSCDNYQSRLVDTLSLYISKLLEEMLGARGAGKGKDLSSSLILVVGLGNRNITADSLGPRVTDRLYINHHILRSEGKNKGLCALSPGVMADTGMETAEIIKGLVRQLKPDAIIAIDALAARDVNRLNKTIQLSDRGINPGSGVGNHRVGINRENIGVPVLAIGVPTVIDAITIVHDSVKPLLRDCSNKERAEFFNSIYTEDMANMYVTPKSIDEDVRIISDTISEAINVLSFHISL